MNVHKIPESCLGSSCVLCGRNATHQLTERAPLAPGLAVASAFLCCAHRYWLVGRQGVNVEPCHAE